MTFNLPNSPLVAIGVPILVLVICSVLSAQNQGDFFYSLADLNEGASNSNVEAEFRPGETGALFIYYSTNGPANSDLDTGAFLDIETSVTDVIQFTAAETFSFAVEAGEQTIGYRWGNQMDQGSCWGETGDVEDETITSLNAFDVAYGTGISEVNTGPLFLDTGYDPAADAFLWGRIEFTVVGEIGSSTELITSPGAGGIVNSGQTVPAVFGAATISVTAVPEPTTAFLATFLLFTTIGFRSKRAKT